MRFQFLFERVVLTICYKLAPSATSNTVLRSLHISNKSSGMHTACPQMEVRDVLLCGIAINVDCSTRMSTYLSIKLNELLSSSPYLDDSYPDHYRDFLLSRGPVPSVSDPENVVVNLSYTMKLAIVGGGASAFYVASRLLSRLPQDAHRIHVFDRLWAPHGLVRYGVAPDHPEVKVRILRALRTMNECLMDPVELHPQIRPNGH